ncbi:hypothetical protein JW949_03365 [Candidatus Woesearchaeota archaeon]|nr:hypothetical protein [Candidatus Woesearchaeota archaeon]
MEENNSPDYIGDLFLKVNLPHTKKTKNYIVCSLEMFIDEEIPIIIKPEHTIDTKKFLYDYIEDINYKIINEENCEIKGRIIMGETIKTPLKKRKRDNIRIEHIKDEWRFNGRELYDETDKYYHLYLEECCKENTRCIMVDSKIIRIKIPNQNKYLYCDLYEGIFETELNEDTSPYDMREIYPPITDYFLQMRSPLRTTKYHTIANII